MSKVIIHPTYFPSISHYVAIINADEIQLEIEDNFQKQTNRNRTYIYSPNGKQLLNVPIQHSNTQPHQKYKDVVIDYSENWQKQHFKSMEAAYRSSPYFEYFEDDIKVVFNKKQKFLLDLNLEIFEIINDCLGVKFKTSKTTEYFKEYSEIKDYRILANGKKDFSIFEQYNQVFQDKHNFINNLSILDLLFNEGRYAVEYLKNQNI